MRPVLSLAALLVAAAGASPALADPVCVQPKEQPLFVEASLSGPCGGGGIVVLRFTAHEIRIIVCLEKLDGSLPECHEEVVRCPNGQCWSVQRPRELNLLS